jgi:zinc/manganese transport system permease protein
MTEVSVLFVPLAAGMLVLLTHVPLGEQVLRRGIVFIDLAIAQVAALGVLAAGAFGDEHEQAWWAGTLAALAASALIAWLSRRWPSQREALIGLVYVTAAALAILWVSSDPHGAQKLKSMTSGDVLWITWQSLLPLALVTGPFLAVHLWKRELWSRSAVFYPCFAVLVSLSVPLLGLYLVFATLIVPALAAMSAARHRGPQALVLGALGYAAGLAASLVWDLPTGPCVVLALVIVGAAAALARATFRQGIAGESAPGSAEKSAQGDGGTLLP